MDSSDIDFSIETTVEKMGGLDTEAANKPWIPIRQGCSRPPFLGVKAKGKGKLSREQRVKEQKGKIRVFVEMHYSQTLSGRYPSYEGVNSEMLFKHFQITHFDHGESFENFNQKIVSIPRMTYITQKNGTVNYMVSPQTEEAFLFLRGMQEERFLSAQAKTEENQSIEEEETVQVGTEDETDTKGVATSMQSRDEGRKEVKEFWTSNYVTSTVQEYISTQAVYSFSRKRNGNVIRP